MKTRHYRIGNAIAILYKRETPLHAEQSILNSWYVSGISLKFNSRYTRDLSIANAGLSDR